MFTLAITSLAVLFCTAAVGPSAETVSKSLSPLSYGFSKVFNITEAQAFVFIAPGMFATAYGLLFACGRQVCAMAESGLLPSVLHWKVPGRGTPFMALVIPSTIGYGFLLVTWFFPWTEKVFFNTCILGSYFSYLASFFSFISIRLFYHGLDKHYTYRSPLGLFGAVIGLLIFALCIVAVAVFQNDGGLSMLVFLSFILAASVCYVLFARDTQRFSPMEKSVMMIAHVLKADRTKKRNRPGRLPDKDEPDGLWSQVLYIFRNRWKNSTIVSGHGAGPRSHVSTVGPIQVANVSVHESEPFYDQDRVSARSESQNKGLWAAVRDALVVGVATTSGPAATPADSYASLSDMRQWGSDSNLAVPMAGRPGTPHDAELGSPNRDANGLSVWSSMRDALSFALAGIAVSTPSGAPHPSSRQISPSSTVVEELQTLDLPSPPNVCIKNSHPHSMPPRAPVLSRPDNMQDENLPKSHHYSTPNVSREISEIDVLNFPSPPGSVGNLAHYIGISVGAEFMPQRDSSGPVPLDSYNNSARISLCSVEEEQAAGTTTYSYSGDFTPRTNFGSHVASSLMAVMNGVAVSSLPSLDNSNQSSKCPSAGSVEHKRQDPTTTPCGSQTPMSEGSEDGHRSAFPSGYVFSAGARSGAGSMSLWTTLRDTLGMTLTNTPRQMSAQSLDTSAQSSKYTSFKEDFLPDDNDAIHNRPYVRTASLDDSYDKVNMHIMDTAKV